MSQSTKLAVWLFGGAVGAMLGFVLPWLGQLADGHSFPYSSVVEFLVSFDAPIMVVGRPLALAAVGFAIAFVVTYVSPDLRITDEEITIIEGDDTRVIARAQVGGIYRRRGKVVIESPEGRTLFAGEVEGGKKAIGSAFAAHHYPWESR